MINLHIKQSWSEERWRHNLLSGEVIGSGIQTNHCPKIVVLNPGRKQNVERCFYKNTSFFIPKTYLRRGDVNLILGFALPDVYMYYVMNRELWILTLTTSTATWLRHVEALRMRQVISDVYLAIRERSNYGFDVHFKTVNAALKSERRPRSHKSKAL